MDTIDRRLLALLQKDATARYTDLAQALGLSAPALHERVKKLRARGTLIRNTVDVDPDALGYQLAAFIHVQTDGWPCDRVADVLERDGFVEEVHSVAGSTSMVVKVRTPSNAALEALLHRIHVLDGVRSAEGFLVLRTYLDRGPDPVAPVEAPDSAGAS